MKPFIATLLVCRISLVLFPILLQFPSLSCTVIVHLLQILVCRHFLSGNVSEMFLPLWYHFIWSHFFFALVSNHMVTSAPFLVLQAPSDHLAIPLFFSIMALMWVWSQFRILSSHFDPVLRFCVARVLDSTCGSSHSSADTTSRISSLFGFRRDLLCIPRVINAEIPIYHGLHLSLHGSVFWW